MFLNRGDSTYRTPVNCSDEWGQLSPFFVGSMDDARFMSFVYPILLLAKAKNGELRLVVRGCHAAYPIIDASRVFTSAVRSNVWIPLQYASPL